MSSGDTAYPLGFKNAAVLLSAAFFGGGAGVCATLISFAVAADVSMPPYYSLQVQEVAHALSLAAFGDQGIMASLLLKSMQWRQHKRILLLCEFRHRARNDLSTLAAPLLLCCLLLMWREGALEV